MLVPHEPSINPITFRGVVAEIKIDGSVANCCYHMGIKLPNPVMRRGGLLIPAATSLIPIAQNQYMREGDNV